MIITEVEGLPLSVKDINTADCDGQYDDFVVRVCTDTGHVGIGESDTPPNVSQALLDAPTQHIWSNNFRELLVGADPLETERLWERLYNGAIYNTRRGLGVMVMSAIDVALHDVAAKGLGRVP